MRYSHPFLLTLVATALVPAPAAGDILSATRYDLVECAHVIDVRVDHGFATLVVRRTVKNNGPKGDQALFSLELPESSVATRLRTNGVDAGGRPVWFEGDLMEATMAAEKYNELTGIGGYSPKDPALLSWLAQRYLTLQIFPVPPRGTKTVEYTLKLPLAYKDGAYRAKLPQMGTDTLNATVRASAAHPGDTITINGVSGSRLVASAATPVTIELRPHNVPTLDGALASVTLGEGRHLVRSSIAAAPRLAEAPRGAHVVVLFDASRSHHAASPALAAVRAYLGSMPEATVEFLTFDREVRAPIGRALPVAAALARLAELSITLRNGSQLDQALARADAILQTSAASTRRVVVITDTLTRSTLGPEPIGSMPWRSGAVVHFAIVADGEPRTARDDHSPWATLPRRTGGLFWRSASASAVDAEARVVFEEWARPKRVDRLSFSGLDDTFERPGELAEGEEIEHFAIARTPVERMSIAGELWSKPIAATFVPTEERNKLASALVFGSDLWRDLSEPEQMQLAVRGRAVSPVTSYLAIEPGVRPSTEGLVFLVGGEELGIGGPDVVMASFSGGHAQLRSGLDTYRWLCDEIAKIAKSCTGSAGDVSAIIESTLDEIVDVRDVTLAPARDAKAEACVLEHAWNLRLPDGFDALLEVHTVKATF